METIDTTTAADDEQEDVPLVVRLCDALKQLERVENNIEEHERQLQQLRAVISNARNRAQKLREEAQQLLNKTTVYKERNLVSEQKLKEQLYNEQQAQDCLLGRTTKQRER